MVVVPWLGIYRTPSELPLAVHDAKMLQPLIAVSFIAMRTRVSKGWIRLGVALSAAWVIGVVTYAVYDFRTTERTAISELKFPDPKLPPGWQLVGPETGVAPISRTVLSL